ncbi:ABC transporter ATP-binding protein [Cysteiniphilum halobium]|uniref:ABC transporter ATP-binding protein n=1 Tax=Cysteiniphilum halobium TaxID=2219059 RepID=UPI000E6550A6|nr:sn-glycerol-3-phosphate ABC transporter ATP-binding protein UgpC [Cysteiniphilum halobium]
MSYLVLENVIKSYGKTEVLHDINLAIESSEFIVIVGESGCGKSTLLRMVAGLENTSSGKISLCGNDITHKEPKERDIAMVFQNYALYPHMSVFNNIAYGLKVRKVAKAEIHKRVQEIAMLLKIDHLLDRKPGELSGGQRQRVAMGRAIIRNPKLFLFDEPLSNLDAKLRVEMRLEIKRLQQRLGITSLYVTHDQVEAMTMADRIVVLNKGYIEQFATPKEIYQKPQSTFVAGFIGAPAMNFLNAKVTEQGIMLDDGGILPLLLKEDNHLGREIIIGIRPEHIVLKELNDDIDLSIVVDMIEHLGGETLIYGFVEKSEARITVKIDGYWQGNVDQVIDLHVKKEHLHAFDQSTMRRIDLNRAIDLAEEPSF